MDPPFPAYKGDEPYIFVSYSHKDARAVFPELTKLRNQGFNIWFDEGIEPGAEWREEIGTAILNARVFLYFVSEASVQSENCRKEVGLADKQKIPTIAIHLEETNLPAGLALTLSDRQAILKHALSEEAYVEKLRTIIASYVDQNIEHTNNPTKPVKRSRAKIILIGIAGTVVFAGMLVIGWISYNKLQISQLQAKHSVAILPFANISNDEDIKVFATGLSEEILDVLAQSESLFGTLNVASRTASFQFTEQKQDPATLGEKLDVAYYLEGSIRKQNAGVRITAQLIRSNDGFHVWSKSYERKLNDGFEVQKAVAVNIAHVLNVRLRTDVLRNGGWKLDPRFNGVESNAVQIFLDALEEFDNIELGEGGDWDRYGQLIKNSTKFDPNFVIGHARLASFVLAMHLRSKLTLQEAGPAAHEALDKANALNSQVPVQRLMIELQTAQVLLALDLDYVTAENIVKTLITYLPNYGMFHYFLAEIDLREGRKNNALRRVANASEFDSGSQQAIYWYAIGIIRQIGRDYHGALKASTRALELSLIGQDRPLMLWSQAFNLIKLGQIEEAKAFIEEGWSLDGITFPERYIALFTLIGEPDRAKAVLSNLDSDAIDNFYLALGYVALRDRDKAFGSIRAGIVNHNRLLLASLIVAEWWDPLRDDPRFDELLAILDAKVTHTEQYLSDHNIEPMSQ